jgi:hypothetical protein
MEKQLSKNRLNFHREWERGAPEDVLNNIRQKIEHYKAAADALEEQPRWISVSDHLPNDTEKVLVYTTTGNTTVARWSQRQEKFVASGHITVTHWMNLPEKPEEEV